MDPIKTGNLIKTLRLELGMTQQQLADGIFVSDKAVSKWERGVGCPDASLLPLLGNILGIDPATILSGELNPNESMGGNMKRLKFYVCGECGNILTSTEEASISCCGRKLMSLESKKAREEEKLSVAILEGDYYISSDHEMSKNNHIAFVAFLNGDTLLLRKLYPEWNLSTRIPKLSRGVLYWYSTQDGLYHQYV
ncbi:helix-turn-helix domain-containing protein [Alkalibacter rhizosphaerae]|uniref:Helix-turn-helix domain-containing protein n=1 Tax=Alkalibacter rhizosphaerae TaxID=2815577 RepID=A0A975AID6_9FIRM|nr:helix-turn-helix domain-containing protein [Alkalibacter rhizosphaerae]QSX08425.1 helix-turn-helix domain-containing protein [Alkalibacter rhizosphaerae]